MVSQSPTHPRRTVLLLQISPFSVGASRLALADLHELQAALGEVSCRAEQFDDLAFAAQAGEREDAVWDLIRHDPEFMAQVDVTARYLRNAKAGRR